MGLFNNATSFPHEGKEFRKINIKVMGNEESILIDSLPKGTYAIAIFHDENYDNICNLNFFGIPKEGYGFSKNFKPKLFAPVFDDCKFQIDTICKLTIRLIY
jgi:uncharacterized protein (DUF2141 family)